MAPIASFIYNKSLDYFGDVVKDDLKKIPPWRRFSLILRDLCVCVII